MQGGVHPELKLEWYIDLLSELSAKHPSIALDCFSPIEIEGISQVCGLPTKVVCSEPSTRERRSKEAVTPPGVKSGQQP